MASLKEMSIFFISSFLETILSSLSTLSNLKILSYLIFEFDRDMSTIEIKTIK